MIRLLYRLLRIAGDIRAARRGRLWDRLANRAIAKQVRRTTRPLYIRRRRRW